MAVAAMAHRRGLTPRILAWRRQKAFRPGWLQQQLTTTVRYRSLLDSTSLPGNTKITMAVISLRQYGMAIIFLDVTRCPLFRQPGCCSLERSLATQDSIILRTMPACMHASAPQCNNLAIPRRGNASCNLLETESISTYLPCGASGITQTYYAHVVAIMLRSGSAAVRTKGVP